MCVVALVHMPDRSSHLEDPAAELSQIDSAVGASWAKRSALVNEAAGSAGSAVFCGL